MPRISRPSPAMAVALIALFVALGGTGYAVTKLPKNSVGNEQLKNDAVDSPKVENYTLKARDFAPGQLQKGPTGPKGPSGTASVMVRDKTEPLAPRDTTGLNVVCESGEIAIAGGGKVSQGVLEGSGPIAFDPAEPLGWSVTGYNNTDADGFITTWAICVPG